MRIISFSTPRARDKPENRGSRNFGDYRRFVAEFIFIAPRAELVYALTKGAAARQASFR